MSLKNRVLKLEGKIYQREPLVIRVYLSGEDGLLTRWNERGEVIETLTREEFEALPGDKIRVNLIGEENEE